jgi:GrpB-like predicted nucleotidyltransferase (UPF0157 family)
MLGLKRKTIKLVPHQKSWEIIFEKETLRIQKEMPDIYIEHIGSTSIPKICAKPILDIVIGLNKFKDLKKCKKKFEKLGYKYHNNRGNAYRAFFTLGPESCRTIYLHVTKYKGAEWNRLIKFRDKLRKDSRLREKYEDLKKQLASKHTNRDYYTKDKDNFIKKVLK